MGDSKLKNSVYSIIQTLAMAAASLVIFKLMVNHLGLKITGVWAYLSAITTITIFGSFGFSNSLVFFIPRYKREEVIGKTSLLINTSFFAVIGFTFLLCLASFAIFYFIIPLTIEQSLIDLAYRLLPLVVISFFAASLSAGYLAVLDGLMLMHVRSKINIAGTVIFLVTGYIFLIKFGLIGVSLAQIIQNLFLFIASYLSMKKYLPGYEFKFQFSKIEFNKVFRYGFNFQLISITQIISEPFMKAMITKFSGTSITAIFDFCVKLLSVFRSIIISANQTIVPQITILKVHNNIQRIKVFFKANFAFVLFISILFFISPIVLNHAIALFFVNGSVNGFNFVFLHVALGLFVNALAIPAHFHYMGIGNLKWNVINNFVAAILIFISAPLLGITVGGQYVILSWSVSAIIGSLVLLFAFFKEYQISLKDFFNRQVFMLLLCIALAWLIISYINDLAVIKTSRFAVLGSNVIVLLLLIAYPVLANTIVQKMMKKAGALYRKNIRKI